MQSQALTENGTTLVQIARPQFATVLAKPWHYRRHGRYYLRLRPRNQTRDLFSVSLRTTDRTLAMELSKNIQRALALFQLNNPEAEWPELKGQLLAIAEELLTMAHGEESIFVHSEAYQELYNALKQASAKGALKPDQHRALGIAKAILAGAHARLQGHSEGLEGIVRQLREEEPVSVPLSVGGQGAATPVTFSHLAGLYMAEQKANVEASTMRDIRSSCASLGEALGGLDMHCHSRSDLIQLREDLLEDRKPSTVNKLVTRLATVLEWAKDNGYLERHFAKNLKIGKGAESTRKAFSQEQVAAVMGHANSLEDGSWARWGLSLGAITGARIAEVRQLTKADIRQVGASWVIDINKRDGKSLKTRHSVRLVPLTAGAYGFDLPAFLGFVEGLPDGAPLFRVGEGQFSQVLNGTLRDVLGYAPGDDWSFHSLRHSLASLMKSQGVAVGLAEAILGHSSQSITFDHYGGGEKVGVPKLADALKMAFVGSVL